jgi:hypothetical protein
MDLQRTCNALATTCNAPLRSACNHPTPFRGWVASSSSCNELATQEEDHDDDDLDLN